MSRLDSGPQNQTEQILLNSSLFSLSLNIHSSRKCAMCNKYPQRQHEPNPCWKQIFKHIDRDGEKFKSDE